MATDIVIRAEGLGKKYVIGHQAEREANPTFRDTIGRSFRNWGRSARDMLRGQAIVAGDETEEFWALRDINFEIKRGDVVGIIGRNGAGKSTLLKVLSRITEPTEGRVTIDGRVASLLEVGTGFHPELTGRENIYLNGAILGMSRAAIKRQFDEIVTFAGVERFLDTPVKRYSSGMYVRLAFAVAAHLEPEILVVDEVLAVGDAEFQNKCLGKMKDVAGHGRTVFFVSHNLSAVQQLCKTAILLDSGRVRAHSNATEIITEYTSQIYQRSPLSVYNLGHTLTQLDITRFIDSSSNTLRTNLFFQSTVDTHYSFETLLYDRHLTPIGFSGLGTIDKAHLVPIHASDNTVEIVLPLNNLATGIYFTSLQITIPGSDVVFREPVDFSFEITRNDPSLSFDSSWGHGSIYLQTDIRTNSV